MDWSVLHAFNDFLTHHDAVEDPLVFYVKASEALFAATLVVVFLAAQGLRWRDWRRAAVAAAASAGLAVLVGAVVSDLVDRARPFVAEPGQLHLFIAHSADASFPSDHATASFAIAVAIVLRKRALGIAALVLAAILSVGRVAVGVHYPSDVLAGAVLGTAAALVLWTPPARRRIDALSDFAGERWDRVLTGGIRTASKLLAR